MDPTVFLLFLGLNWNLRTNSESSVGFIIVLLFACVVLTLMLSLVNSDSPFVAVVMVVETARGWIAVSTMGMEELGCMYSTD